MISFRRNKLKIGLLAVFASVFFSASFASGNVFATPIGASEIQKLAVLRGVYNCYKTNAKAEIQKSDFSSFTSIFNQSGNWTTDDVTILPTKVGNTINDDGLRCSETISGYDGAGGKSTGFKDYYSYPTTLEDSGYYFDHTEGSGDGKSGTAEATTDQITITIDSIKDKSGSNKNPTTITGSIVLDGEQKYHDGWFNDYYYWETTKVSGTISISYDNEEIFHLEYVGGNHYPSVYNKSGIISYDSTALQMATDGSVTGQTSGSRLTFAAARQVLLDDIKANITPELGYYIEPEISASIKSTAPKTDDKNNANSVYKVYSNESTAAQVMFRKVNIDGVPYTDGHLSALGNRPAVDLRTPIWNSNYKYGLYYAYLQNIMSEYTDIKLGECTKDKPSEPGYYFKGKKDNWCVINIPGSAQAALSKRVAIVGSTDLEMGTFKDVLEWFGNEDNYKYVDEDKYAEMDSNGDPTNPGGGEDKPDDGKKTKEEELEEACYRQAKSLGWIICPIIFGLQEVTTNIYQQVEPMIRVNDTVINQIQQGNSGGGEMFKAWNTFRSIANIIFVILFLFIIFSQLTGIGIDNYGIKKMLPKVIVTAILVNVSFLLCALAVDVSNILGKALQDLFITIAPSAAVLKDTSAVGGTIETINNAVNIIAIAGTVGIGVGALILNGWAIIIPIFLFLIVMIISIIFALIVLGLRQAFVILLIIISPIAFACTLLPNTESVFKKWFDFFKQILMVYPIVGGLIGAGYFAARMILTSEADLIMTITAGMLCVAPYFLVPSLTRKSLAAAGDIGNKLRGASRGIGKRVNGLNNTNAVRNARANSRAARDESRAQRWMNSRRAQKIQNDMAAGKTISRHRANKYAQKAALATQSRQASIAARSAQSQYGRLSSQSGYQAAMSAANMAEDATTTKNFETMLAAGDYKYDTGRVDAEGNAVMQTVDSQSNQQIADALEHELMQTGENYDANKVRALSNALAAKGKEGRSLMYDKASAAQSNGASNQAIKDFSSNIMNNHAGTMKEKARSLYEFAKNTSDVQLDQNGNIVPSYTKNKNGENVLSGGLVDNGNGSFSLKNISEFASAGTGSLTAGDMTSMDKQQLERYSANATGDNLRTLGQLANQALTDDHLSQNLSDTSRKLLEGLRDKASSAGYDVTATSGNTLNVDHSTPTPAPTVAPAQTAAAQAAGANTATIRATQISDATRARAAANGRVNPDVERAIDQSNNGGGRQTDSGIWLPS